MAIVMNGRVYIIMEYYYRNQVSKLANVNIETLIYYEKIGLIPVPARKENSYRIYSEDIFKRLVLIGEAKEAGFTLNEIKQVLLSNKDGEFDASYFLTLLQNKLDEINSRMDKLSSIKNMLEGAKDNMISGRGCGTLQKCRINNT
jgi:MerR family mercuric resistance operon transcriptional regulator/MerR family Zn(II)-responsive transcriptional regulator of zntA